MMYQVNPGLKGSTVKSLISKSCKETVTKDEYVYKLPDAVGCYTEAKNVPTSENDINWPSGIVTGITKSADNELLGNVKITAVRKSTGEYNLGKYSFVFQSDEEGNYVQTLPQGIYDLVVSKEGYLPYVCNDIVVQPDETNYVETIFLSYLTALLTENKVQGNVKDALNGNPIEGAVVKFRKGWNNKKGVYCKTLFGSVKQTKTNSNGDFDYGIFVGAYTAEISKDGYITSYYNVISGPSGDYSVLSQVDIVLTPILENDEYRIILTWGDEPSDLDSHLTYYVGNEKNVKFF